MNNSRALLIIVIMFSFFIVLALKLYTIQLTDHEMYSQIAKKQQDKSSVIKAERGSILDRNNEVLVYTNNEVSLFVDTRMVSKANRDTIATKFSSVFNKDKSHYLNLLNSGNKNICLERKISKEKALHFKNFVLDGFYKQEDFTRVFAYGSMLSHLVGYVNKQCNGINGIEKEYDKYLKGNDGIRIIEKDVIGRTVSVKDNLSKSAVPGNDLVLTINKSFQKILEEELKAGLEKYKSDSAIGIIMNPNTGELLALSNLPDYDPGNYSLFNDNLRRNRSITDTYEPGSTIKPLIMSILIEEDLARSNEIINTENGVYNIGRTKIRDTHEYSELSVRRVLEESSNIGMSKLSNRIQPDMFYKYLRNFGLGVKTGVDIPGEIDGYLKKPKHYSKISKNFMSFGYELSITPLQLITAFSATINGGILYKPYAVDKIIDSENNIARQFFPEKIRRVISERTSDILKDMMIGVVEEGTGKNARLESAVIGGKTGTAQRIVNGSYSRREYNSSFVGFLPAENPRIICLIKVSSPKIGRYGGQVGAPIFKNIAERIVKADLSIVPEELKIKRKKMFVEKILTDIESESKASFFTSSNIADIEKEKEEYVDISNNEMPDLKGLSMRAAISTLNRFGVKYKIKGNGRVESQSILPGSTFDYEDICIIKCRTMKQITGLHIN